MSEIFLIGLPTRALVACAPTIKKIMRCTKQMPKNADINGISTFTLIKTTIALTYMYIASDHTRACTHEKFVIAH